MRLWRRMVFFLIFAALPLVGLLVAPDGLLSPQRLYAAGTYYVAKNGSDSNPGSQASPWLTIQKAANSAVAGDTIYVRSGIYSEYVYIGTSGPYSGKSGNSSNPITYKAYPGESAVIDGTGLPDPGWRGLITLNNVSYITLSGLEIRNTPYQKGVCIFNSSNNVTLTNLKIHDIQKSGIYVETASNLVIDSCQVYNTNRIVDSDEQVSLIGVNNSEIKNSLFHNSGKNAIDFKNGSNNGSVHDNEIYGSNDTSTGIYIDANGSPQDNFKIFNNKIHDCIAPAIVLGSETSPFAPVTNVDIYNNLIYNNNTGFAVWQNPFTRTFRIINNTFYNNGAEIAVYGVGSNAGVNSNCIIRNNILVHSGYYMINFEATIGGTASIDSNLYYDPSGAYNFNPSNLLGTNYIKANPLLVSPTSNFNLKAGSPAIDAGSSTGAPLTDYAGTARPQGSKYDIGAYEYLPGSLP